MAKRLKIEIGSKYGKLEVIDNNGFIRLPCGQINRLIRCRCECGNEKNIRLAHLLRGRISSWVVS